MPANYVLLATTTTNTTVATIDLLNIPQTGYTDLVVTWTTRTPNTTPIADNLLIAFNGSAGNGIAEVLAGNGSTASQFSDTGTYTAMGTVGGAATANVFSNGQLYIVDYASSTKFKNMQLETVTENIATYSGTAIATFSYQLTTPISSITLVPNYANFTANCTFSIYGVAAVGTTPVIVPKASGGDIITNDGTYWYHTFLATGTFTPASALTCDYLVVAGGGAGVGNSGGGGGAGGMRCTVTGTGGSGSLESPLSLLANTPYSVAIGAGGAGAVATNNIRGANGSNSVFASITSTGGGGGGNRLGGSPIGNGAVGGSGGGAAVDGYTGGAGTSGQGFGGGDAPGATNPAGGGGGAAAAGQIGGSANLGGGDGGAGRATVISGTSTYYAGGGGGAYNIAGSGEGGVGGGASSPTTSNTGGNAGTVNTGGGGSAGVGGAGTGNNGGSGGSGIVVVRYAMA